MTFHQPPHPFYAKIHGVVNLFSSSPIHLEAFIMYEADIGLESVSHSDNHGNALWKCLHIRSASLMGIHCLPIGNFA